MLIPTSPLLNEAVLGFLDRPRIIPFEAARQMVFLEASSSPHWCIEKLVTIVTEAREMKNVPFEPVRFVCRRQAMLFFEAWSRSETHLAGGEPALVHAVVDGVVD